MFSSKTPGEAKRRIRNQLKILNEGGLGKYLGLPEHFGRKSEIFLPPWLIGSVNVRTAGRRDSYRGLGR